VVLGRLMRAPVIAWHAGSRPEAYFGKRVRRVTLPRADCLIASSRGEAEMLQERFRVSPGKLRIILTPIDLIEYKMESREAAARALGLPAGRRYALFVGRFDDAVKRIGWMVRAVERLSVRYPELTLLLVGDGADRPRLEVEARKLDPGRVLFRGWERDAARKALYYNSAEVLLIPSLREGFPTVVGEAMACGTPVVGSSVGGIPEMVINGQTGFLHAPSDEAGFGQALGGLLENKALAERMRAICRSMAEARLAEDVVGLQLKECFVAAGVRNVE
jgi:glycosyltransferase involved in cell wall biosynthesis